MTSILIADDNLQLVNILSEYSCKEGYKVYKAFDGQQALDIFENNDISVILLDIAMPKKTVSKSVNSLDNTPTYQ